MKKMQVLLAGVALTALFGSAIPVAHATGEVAFSDLGGHWAEKSILSMCEGANPLFKGVGTDEDGLALFAPEKEMTGAEFVTVLVRAYYGDELNSEPVVGAWYSPSWTVAERHGLVDETDIAFQEVAIPRKVMAKVIVKAMIMQGETLEPMAPIGSIADYDQIGAEYQNFVRQVYSMGIITGTDQAGTFSPDLTVSRAQGATILNRLVNPVERVEFTDVEPVKNPFANTNRSSEDWYKPASTLQTFTEGEAHTIPQAGDTVITKDGRTVVLEATVIGGREMLGYGQGVDIVTGTVVNGHTCSETVAPNGDIVLGGGFFDRDRTVFKKSTLTNEVFTDEQWGLIANKTYPTGKTATEDGEIFNVYWRWSTADSSWHWVGE